MWVAAATLLAMGVGVMGQAKPKMPADVGPGRIAWFDIASSDLRRSQEFYGKMFGWTFTPVPGTDQAVEINSRGTGIGTIRAAEGRVSSYNGVVYVQVDDARSATDRAKALGATVVDGLSAEPDDGDRHDRPDPGSDRPSTRHVFPKGSADEEPVGRRSAPARTRTWDPGLRRPPVLTVVS
jgi:uncharacterized protein